MMDLRHVQAFCAIVRLGSFSAAAKALSTTQPSISMRIRELERELGVQLFDTKSRRTKLTQKGRKFIFHAEELLKLVDTIQESMADDKIVSGTIRFGATETVAMTWLSSFVESVKKTYPDIVLELDIDLTFDLWAKFHAGMLDVLIVPPPVGELGVYCEPLGEFEYCWMASPKLGIPHKRFSPMELAEYPIITLSASSALYQMTVRWFGDHGSAPNWVNHCSSVSMVAALTQSALGISLLPSTVLKERSAAENLQLLEVHPPFPKLKFFVVYGTYAISSALKAVVDIAKATSTFTPPDTSMDESP
ncbi:LysR family transcriptional regulator [Pseudaminobacter sp. 19-2017]|uniref:LysR family transcriptional regulator n=1 Tax=Pseudaminobacter soli (ex Zhang et al. 2022) TaxID=2831468 RepID=A0A942DVX7_9HYPH|nr:LysR family transcriptional regulator [Pseudaminobacter soli]MBS3648519.1 LysR family transcriptional regulator [Pseudaminobacter soli]